MAVGPGAFAESADEMDGAEVGEVDIVAGLIARMTIPTVPVGISWAVLLYDNACHRVISGTAPLPDAHRFGVHLLFPFGYALEMYTYPAVA